MNWSTELSKKNKWSISIFGTTPTYSHTQRVFQLIEHMILKLNHQLLFQDDITSTDESGDESSNDENFLVPNQNHQKAPTPQHHHQQQQQQQHHQQIVPNAVSMQRNHEEDSKQLLHQQSQNQKINEKMFDNQKLLLESLSNLPPNLLQSWIESGQLQVSVDDSKYSFYHF